MSKRHSVHPHDGFFKLLVESKKKVADLIRGTFPEYLIKKLDLRTLRNTATTYTNAKAGNFRADVVYECQYGEGRIMVTLLFEHKSYVEKFPHLQLMNYMSGIWEKERKNRPDLRLIVPIIFYHGQRKWPKLDFADYFEGSVARGGKGIDPELLRFIPQFDYLLVDLQKKGDEWIWRQIKQPGLRMQLLVMRNMQSQGFLHRLEEIMKGWEELIKSDEGKREFEEILIYLISAYAGREEEIIEFMDNATFTDSPYRKGTLGWHLDKRFGVQIRAEARGEGKAEGKAEVALNLLEDGFGVGRVAKLTGLSIEEVEKLKEKAN